MCYTNCNISCLTNFSWKMQPDESEARRLGRSLIISRKVQKGEMITTENVKVLRTAIGIATKYCNKVTGSF